MRTIKDQVIVQFQLLVSLPPIKIFRHHERRKHRARISGVVYLSCRFWGKTWPNRLHPISRHFKIAIEVVWYGRASIADSTDDKHEKFRQSQQADPKAVSRRVVFYFLLFSWIADVYYASQGGVLDHLAIGLWTLHSPFLQCLVLDDCASLKSYLFRLVRHNKRNKKSARPAFCTRGGNTEVGPHDVSLR
jgi:hypothetical protein